MKELLTQKISNKQKIYNSIINKPKNKYNFKLAYALASFIFMFIVGFTVYNKDTSMITIDINPSIVLKGNYFDKVVRIEGLNNEARDLLDNLNLYGKDIEEATELILKEATKQGYIDKTMDDNAILISTTCKNENQQNKIQNKVNNSINNYLNKNGIHSLIIEQELKEEDFNVINEYGISYNKMKFIKRAITDNPELKVEDLVRLPVREIVKYINEYKNIERNNCQGNGYCNGGN